MPTTTRQRIGDALKKALPWVLVLLMIGAVVSELRGRGGIDSGKSAPPLALALSDGSHFDLARGRGHVRVINFWGTYCPPCRREAPSLTEVWREMRTHGDDLIGVAADDAELRDVAAFARQIGAAYPVAMGSQELLALYQVRLLPTTYVINGEGMITRTVVGEITSDELREAIREARAQ